MLPHLRSKVWFRGEELKVTVTITITVAIAIVGLLRLRCEPRVLIVVGIEQQRIKRFVCNVRRERGCRSVGRRAA